MWSDIYVTPDIDDMILGDDWLRKRSRMTWDFDNDHVRFGDDEWIELQRGSDHHSLHSTSGFIISIAVVPLYSAYLCVCVCVCVSVFLSVCYCCFFLIVVFTYSAH